MAEGVQANSGRCRVLGAQLVWSTADGRLMVVWIRTPRWTKTCRTRQRLHVGDPRARPVAAAMVAAEEVLDDEASTESHMGAEYSAFGGGRSFRPWCRLRGHHTDSASLDWWSCSRTSALPGRRHDKPFRPRRCRQPLGKRNPAKPGPKDRSGTARQVRNHWLEVCTFLLATVIL